MNQKFLACGQALNLILEFKNKLRFPCNIDFFFFFKYKILQHGMLYAVVT